jgi:hypothetical protein
MDRIRKKYVDEEEGEEGGNMLESNCYWCFDALCSRVLARYYTEDMVELQVDQLVMQQLLEEKFPTVATQMDNLGVSLACVSSSWLLCGFANALPWTTLLRTWDVLLFPDTEGEQGKTENDTTTPREQEPNANANTVQSSLLFKFTLALVDIHSRSLIQCKDPTQLIVLLQSMAVQSFDSSQLVTIACQGFSDVNKGKLEEYRQLYRPIVMQTFGRNNFGAAPSSSSSSYMGSDKSANQTEDTPEVARVRDRLGLKSIDESDPSAMQSTQGDPDTARTNTSTASGGNLSSSRLLRRRFLGTHGSFGLLSPFSRQNSVRRAVSTSSAFGFNGGSSSQNMMTNQQGPGGHAALGENADSIVNEQIMQLTSARYYLEKQVVDLIGIIARMNKDLREKDQQRYEQSLHLESLEVQNKKLLDSVDALKKEMTQKVESLEAKDDLMHMLHEKISKQSLEISTKDSKLNELRNRSDSPKAKLSQQFSQLKQNIFSRSDKKKSVPPTPEHDNHNKSSGT